MVKSESPIELIKLPYEDEVYRSKFEISGTWGSSNAAGPLNGLYYKQNPKYLLAVDARCSFLIRIILDEQKYGTIPVNLSIFKIADSTLGK